MTAMDISAVPPRRSRLLRLSVYVLVLALCVPTDLFSALFPGQRQLLVPLATALAVVAWIIFMRGRFTAIRGNVSLIWASLILFLGLALLSAVTHPNAADSLALIAAYTTRFAMAFVLVQIMVDDDGLLVRVQRLLVVALAVLALLMVSGILDRFGGYLLVTEAAGSRIGRASAGLGDPNFTALAFNIGLALGLSWFATARRRGERWLTVASSLVLVLGIGKTVSIGGLVGLVLILTLFCWRMVRLAGRRRWGLTLLTAGMLVAIATAAGSVYLARIQQQAVRAHQSIGTLGTQRLNLSLGGLRMAAANPILGVGPANTADAMPGYLLFYSSEPNQESHNGFIDIMDETGIPSFLLMAGMGILMFKLARSAQRCLRKAGDRYWYLIGEGAWIALAATLVQTLALGTQRQPFLWLVMALVLSLALRVRQSRGVLDRMPLSVH